MFYILLFVSAVLLALDFAINKLYQKRMGTTASAGFLYNALQGLASCIIFFAIGGFKFNITPYSLLMAAILAVLIMSYNLIGFRIMKKGSVAIYTLFLMTGGMLVPYIWGIAFLNEEFVWLRAVGVILIIFAVALSNFSKQKFATTQLLMCVAVFVLNGFNSVVSKVHQVETSFETVNPFNFVALVGLCRFVVSGVAYIVCEAKNKNEKTKVDFKTVGLIVPISAVLCGLASACLLIGAANLPATVVFPINTGGTMILSALAGVIFFKDKLSKSIVIGIAVCFIGTLMFL